jgi:hypothetical protein
LIDLATTDPLIVPATLDAQIARFVTANTSFQQALLAAVAQRW